MADLAAQLTLEQVEPLLNKTCFVVVDLETTGGSPTNDAITEIGAVKVQGGQVIGEFATLVDPGLTIPPQIVALTGISDAMLVNAPRIEEVLPSFLEFARGSVLVAHNAGFDTGFLRANAERMSIAWPRCSVVCTVRLARRVLSKDEAPSVRLSSLAALLNSTVTPTHRALDDARATVEVLHALLERVGNQGVHTLRELLDYQPQVCAGQRAKRGLAAGLPNAPGVYLFRGPSDEVLYVGTAVDLRRRVRNYFSGSEPRARMKEMVALATRVDHVQCAHGLEAGVRELRLLAAHAPAYNRRSKYPKRAWWVRLTDEAFPRLTVSRVNGPIAVGPFTNRARAAEYANLVAELSGLRTCTYPLSASAIHGPRCSNAAVGGCTAARRNGTQSATDYGSATLAARNYLVGNCDDLTADLLTQISDHAANGHFETAARLRDRTEAAISATGRCQRLAAVASIAELVAARPVNAEAWTAHRRPGGWELIVVRYGRLAASGVCRTGESVTGVVERLCQCAETVFPDDTVLRGAMPEELALITRWLHQPGTRLVSSTSGYSEPARGTGRWLDWAQRAKSARAG